MLPLFNYHYSAGVASDDTRIERGTKNLRRKEIEWKEERERKKEREGGRNGRK